MLIGRRVADLRQRFKHVLALGLGVGRSVDHREVRGRRRLVGCEQAQGGRLRVIHRGDTHGRVVVKIHFVEVLRIAASSPC